MRLPVITADVLVVGGGTGGTAAAIQSARRGAQTLLVSEFPWLGGMLTAAGVSAPDGNELLAFQTGLWGAFLRELRRRQPGGLDNAWVSCFTYEPKVGAAIFADWVNALPNLTWVAGQRPRSVIRRGDLVAGVCFDALIVHADITLDGTELGDLLALGEVAHRWGWETQAIFAEPSAPKSLTDPAASLHPLVHTYPVQSPTWVVIMEEAGKDEKEAAISPGEYDERQFKGAWQGYGAEKFLTYGKLPGNQFMINWPQRGNDYGIKLNRLIQGDTAWQAWATEAIAHSRHFAHFIQAELGLRYRLAKAAFPKLPGQYGGGAFALHPYYRESRRLVGVTTVSEQDILPQSGGTVAALPINGQGQMSAIAIGNYPNDHHYPGFAMPLVSKSLCWGGRWTGTPFALPYEALVPLAVDGLLVCEKNISVSHIANGATRLQPVVLGLGQAAGMAAALCIEQGCQPRDLSVEVLQQALISEPHAPAAIVPLWNILPQSKDWQSYQHHYQTYPQDYPQGGYVPHQDIWEEAAVVNALSSGAVTVEGTLQARMNQACWQFQLNTSRFGPLALITLAPTINRQMSQLKNKQFIKVLGIPNTAARWIQVLKII